MGISCVYTMQVSHIQHIILVPTVIFGCEMRNSTHIQLIVLI